MALPHSPEKKELTEGDPVLRARDEDLINWNRLKNFMQVEVNVLCMHTNFDGCRYSGFGDIATFKNSQISLSDHGL